MASQSRIEMRKAQALEEINLRLKRIEEKLGIVVEPDTAAYPGEEAAAENEGEGKTKTEANSK